MAQPKGKYWIANNPSAEVTNGEAVEVEQLVGKTPQLAVADLDQDISVGYTEAEIQAISDKVDVILDRLRSAGIIAN